MKTNKELIESLTRYLENHINIVSNRGAPYAFDSGAMKDLYGILQIRSRFEKFKVNNLVFVFDDFDNEGCIHGHPYSNCLGWSVRKNELDDESYRVDLYFYNLLSPLTSVASQLYIQIEDNINNKVYKATIRPRYQKNIEALANDTFKLIAKTVSEVLK